MQRFVVKHRLQISAQILRNCVWNVNANYAGCSCICTNFLLLPLLYGVYYLSTGKYPENHEQVYEMFPGVRIPNMTDDKKVILENINKHIEAVTAIVNQVDAMKV